MIRPADGVPGSGSVCQDPFYTRILSLFEGYGASVSFVGFWLQTVDGEAAAAISRFEDKFSLYLTERSDLEEIAAFLRFQGAGSVMLDGKFTLDIHAKYAISGQVLEYQGEAYHSELELYRPDCQRLYRLLQSCTSDIFIVPDYMMFLSDVTHRSNLGKCTVIGVDVNGALASSVMTVSETAHAAILGAVATHPDYRNRGLSGALVRTLASQITGEGRRAFVFSASEVNTRFYERLGFRITAGFQELFLES